MTETESPTVLVVDDERDVADAYAAQLQREYDVVTAYGGQEAIDTLDESVDVMLLDRRMPGVSGDDVLEYVREEGLDCRVAMVTAVDPDFDIIEMPFDDYVIKPVSRDDLLETIDHLLSVSDYRRKLQKYYALSAKHATLLANKPDSELADSEEFQALTEQMDELRSELDDHLADFGDEDFETAFRDLGTIED
ncbi:DNA-binding protein [Halobacteriales archaeon SW_10_68_16]|jgi:DNA-binding response OmpR family regulator|nr:MAG: DNA-binding protein [Halobacteriales archaeon SW_10_68_16]